jgi:hypothetical protein
MSKFVLSAPAAVARAATTDRTLYSALRPVVVGPVAGLHRFAVTAERAPLGAYDPVDTVAYPYPNRAAGSLVDLPYVKLYAATALLNYFNKFIGIGGSCQVNSTYLNRVRTSNYVFATGNGVSRSSAFGDRDVQIGDVAVVSGTNGLSQLLTLTTTVTGFAGEPVPASVGAASGDANNANTQSASVSISQVPGTPVNDIGATANGAAYESTADGFITRTYTITVTQSSTGSDATTARLRVASADGLDSASNVVPAAFGSPTPIGSKGLTVTFTDTHGLSSGSGIAPDDLLVGQAWTVTVAQAFTAPVATSGGTYAGTKTTTYIVQVTLGGKYTAPTQPQITVTSTNGYDRSGPTTVTAPSTAVPIGNFGTTIKFNQTALRDNDVYYVTCTAAGQGALQTLVLKDNVDASLTGLELNLQLYAQRSDLLIPAGVLLPTPLTCWAAGADAITVHAGIQLFDPQFTSGGVPVPVPLGSADLFVEYREWLTEGTGAAGQVVVVSDPAQIPPLLGTITPDNPLAYAANAALADTAGQLLADPTRPAAATTDVVKCVPLGGDPAVLAGWQSALDLVADDDEAYQLVPLTADPTTQDLFAAHVEARSADPVGFYRVCWIDRPLRPTGAIVSAANTTDLAPATATITATPGTSPTAYMTVTASANAKFVTHGVAPGDQVRINFGTDPFGNPTFSSYAVASVTSETVLVLLSGPAAPISVARMTEVWRTFSKDQLVAQLSAVAQGYANSRVRLVYPDQPALGGTVLPGYYLCAALSGLAGSVPSQQGLKNVGLVGFDDLTRASKFFTGVQLDALAAAGVFVVSQTPQGVVYVRNAVTTDPSSLANREETMVRNADMIRKAIQDAWAPYVGAGNVVSNLQQLLAGALASLAHRLKAANQVPELGPPVGDLQLTSVSTDPSQPDVADAVVTPVGIAVPLNQLVIRLALS